MLAELAAIVVSAVPAPAADAAEGPWRTSLRYSRGAPWTCAQLVRGEAYGGAALCDTSEGRRPIGVATWQRRGGRTFVFGLVSPRARLVWVDGARRSRAVEVGEEFPDGSRPFLVALPRRTRTSGLVVRATLRGGGNAERRVRRF